MPVHKPTSRDFVPLYDDLFQKATKLSKIGDFFAKKARHRIGCLELAPPARLELTTSRLGGARSIQVSYGGI